MKSTRSFITTVSLLPVLCTAGCAHGITRFRADELIKEPCVRIDSGTRIVRVLVTGTADSPIAGATVRLEAPTGEIEAMTGADGQTELSVPLESSTLRINLSGFHPTEVRRVVVQDGCRAFLEVPLELDSRYVDF